MEFGIKKCGVKVLKRKKLIKLNTEVWISQMRSGENNLGWYLKNSNENLLQGAKQSGFWSSGRASQRKLERETNVWTSDSNGIRTRNHLVRKRTVWPLWLGGWVFVYELSSCGFESHCCHLNFRYRTYFEQGVAWHSVNYRV